MGLGKVLEDINDNYFRVEGLAGYQEWVANAKELSNESAKKAYEETGNECIKKALEWSELVNQSLMMVSMSKKQPFEGAENAVKLSRECAEETGNECIKKALEWSELVNQSLMMVSMSKKQPFEGAENAVKLSRECADVAIVTAANGSEIKKEWKNLDIMKYTDVLASQETGTKRRSGISGDRYENQMFKSFDG